MTTDVYVSSRKKKSWNVVVKVLGSLYRYFIRKEMWEIALGPVLFVHRVECTLQCVNSFWLAIRPASVHTGG